MVIATLGFLGGAIAALVFGENFTASIFGGLTVLGLLGMYEAFYYSFEIHPDKIMSFDIHRVKELRLSDIENIALDDKYIYFFPKQTHHKRIKTTRYLKDFGEVVDWAHEQFPNRDVETLNEEYDEIYSNEEYGRDVDERQLNLEAAHKRAKILNSIAWITVPWGFFYPKPYEYLIVVLVLIPLIAIGMIWQSKGLISVGGKDTSSMESARPSVMTAILMPGLVLGLRALLDCSIYDYGYTVWWVAGIALLLSLVVVKQLSLGDPMKLKDYLMIVPIVSVLFGFYTYGAVLESNMLLDESIPTYYSAEVLCKHKSSGKVDNYYFQLTPWGPDRLTEDAEVSSVLYNSVLVGDTVAVWHYDGYWNIPRYQISK